MNKLNLTIIIISTLLLFGCATGDRIEIYESGIITLNKKKISFDDLLAIVLETDRLEGDTPIIYISADGGRRNSTVDREVATYIESVNNYYFPDPEINESSEDPFSEKHDDEHAENQINEQHTKKIE